MNYKEQLASPKWQRRRLEIFNRDGWACTECGETEKQLEVHHIKYLAGKHPAESPDADLATLCDKCHDLRHLPQARPLAEMEQTRLELLDKIKAGENPKAVPAWRMAVSLIEAEALKIYGTDLANQVKAA